MICFLQLRDDNAIIGFCSENAIKGNETIYTIMADLQADVCENIVDYKTGVPLYKYENGEAKARTEEEINAEKNSVKTEEPTQLDRLEAQATYTAMMTDTLLEV